MPVRRGVQYAGTRCYRGPMHDPVFAERVAEKLAQTRVQPFTTADALAMFEVQLGRLTRGTHKGGLRGWATVEVVSEGGWKRGGPSYHGDGPVGRVVRPGELVRVTVSDFAGKILFEEVC